MSSTILQQIGPDHYVCQTTVVNEMGLHARPASLFVETANQFLSEVLIRKGKDEKNGKSILQLLTLSAEMGTTLELETKGSDAQAAIAALAALIEAGFNEMEEADA